MLTPKIFDKLEQTPRGAGGEIQLTDAIEALMAGAGGLRVRVRGHPLRRGHDDGLAEGVGRAGAPAAGPRRRVPRYLRARALTWSRSHGRPASYGTMPARTRRASPEATA